MLVLRWLLFGLRKMFGRAIYFFPFSRTIFTDFLGSCSDSGDSHDNHSAISPQANSVSKLQVGFVSSRLHHSIQYKFYHGTFTFPNVHCWFTEFQMPILRKKSGLFFDISSFKLKKSQVFANIRRLSIFLILPIFKMGSSDFSSLFVRSQ